MVREQPQAQALHKHPAPYQQDLHPDAIAGQNLGLGEMQPWQQARTAYDMKAVHCCPHTFSDDELTQIPLLPEESR
jgi:hypothetical protein